MKRRWRPVRLILAGVLITLAALLFYAWPIGPRWRLAKQPNHLKMESHQPIGFDLSRGLLWTLATAYNMPPVFQGLNLKTGAVETLLQLDFKSHDVTGFLPSTFARMSANGKTLMCKAKHELLLFDVSQQGSSLPEPDSTGVQSSALSPDGQYYAVLTPRQIRVHECRTGKAVCQIPTPVGVLSGAVGSAPSVNQMLFTNDGRFLAVGGDDYGIRIFNITTGQFLGECSPSTIPVFLNDNKGFLGLSQQLATSWSHPVCRYHDVSQPSSFTDSQWLRLNAATMKKNLPKTVYGQRVIHANSARILLAFLDVTERSVPAWLPEFVKQKVAEYFDWKMPHICIQSWNTETFQFQDAFTIKIVDYYRSALSPDGQLLAVEDEEALSLYDIPPSSRSHTAWLLCSGLLALAMAILTLRRKAQPGAPPARPA